MTNGQARWEPGSKGEFVGWDKRSAVPPIVLSSGFWWDRAALVPPYTNCPEIGGRSHARHETIGQNDCGRGRRDDGAGLCRRRQWRRSGERRPAKEETYTITSVIQVLKPANPADMNDDFQDARVLSQDKDSYTVEITYYPLYHPAVGENPDWRKDDAEMVEYLRPTLTENWDETMRRDLVAELRQAGIDPDRLTDKQLVEQVSRWAMGRAHSTQAFGIWAACFPDGKPTVYPPLRQAFDREKARRAWTDQQMFDQEVLGRSMFYNKVHGSCTSSSVYLATILRAVGIPDPHRLLHSAVRPERRRAGPDVL